MHIISPLEVIPHLKEKTRWQNLMKVNWDPDASPLKKLYQLVKNQAKGEWESEREREREKRSKRNKAFAYFPVQSGAFLVMVYSLKEEEKRGT